MATVFLHGQTGGRKGKSDVVIATMPPGDADILRTLDLGVDVSNCDIYARALTHTRSNYVISFDTVNMYGRIASTTSIYRLTLTRDGTCITFKLDSANSYLSGDWIFSIIRK